MLDLSKIITIRVSQDMWNDLGRIADSRRSETLNTNPPHINNVYG